ncbi:hypothetical protein OCOJLMKI_4544 [Methylobacterium iners]|uniref:Uncharacterized protein n=1 Tax=Methylobacterium iners TaxID=418707 RepID=A0ABQ4S3X9_9HYPH|nr:hypothetical protein OCOJLMKI_4544 [Methylobacterium iners]
MFIGPKSERRPANEKARRGANRAGLAQSYGCEAAMLGHMPNWKRSP